MSDSSYSIDYHAFPNLADINKLTEEISAYAKQKKGLDPLEGFAFFMRDKNKQLLGGCNGSIYYGALYIDQLWVRETLRGHSFGTELMQAAEKLGKEKGCKFAVLTTMDWEGLGFYQKLGYIIEFERHGYSKNSVLYTLRKNFQ